MPTRRREARKVATTRRGTAKKTENQPALPRGYRTVVADIKRLIADSRHRALSTVNRELVLLYWQIGAVIVRQQETAKWGDAVVEQLAEDLRAAFPDMKGLSRPNLWKMRQFFHSCHEIDHWLAASTVEHSSSQDVETAPRQILSTVSREMARERKVATVSPQSSDEILSTLSREFRSPDVPPLIAGLSWSHHTEICGVSDDAAERYFYMAMAIRERWSVRELRRQIDSDLLTRYVSVREHPEECLPAEMEQGDLLPFKDHYVLEFLGLENEHSEQQLRHAILANLRDFFLEFGRDLTFVGEEYPLTVGADTFYIDLLFFHRRLQCLVAVELKIGKFKPEYVGKSQFYCAALDEQIKLPQEKPSIGLVLCKSADCVQVRLALTAAADKIGVATYQTALPDTKLIQQRLKQLPSIDKEDAGGPP